MLALCLTLLVAYYAGIFLLEPSYQPTLLENFSWLIVKQVYPLTINFPPLHLGVRDEEKY